MKREKLKLPPSPTPHECVIVAVDPGENSGWSIWYSGELASFGECDVFGSEPSQLLQRTLASNAVGQRLPVVLVTERPFMVRSTNSTGIGTAEKIWREQAKRLGFSKRVVRVYPNRWRATQLNKGWHKLERDDVRLHEQGVASEYTYTHGFKESPGDDACPAILIGRWAAHAGEVGAVLPKPRKRKAA